MLQQFITVKHCFVLEVGVGRGGEVGVVGTPMEELGVVEMESTEESWEACMDINSMLNKSGES